MGGIRRHSACLYPCLSCRCRRRSFLCPCLSFLLPLPFFPLSLPFFLSFPLGESASAQANAFLSVIPLRGICFCRCLCFSFRHSLRGICFCPSSCFSFCHTPKENLLLAVSPTSPQEEDPNSRPARPSSPNTEQGRETTNPSQSPPPRLQAEDPDSRPAQTRTSANGAHHPSPGQSPSASSATAWVRNPQKENKG